MAEPHRAAACGGGPLERVAGLQLLPNALISQGNSAHGARKSRIRSRARRHRAAPDQRATPAATNRYPGRARKSPRRTAPQARRSRVSTSSSIRRGAAYGRDTTGIMPRSTLRIAPISSIASRQRVARISRQLCAGSLAIPTMPMRLSVVRGVTGRCHGCGHMTTPNSSFWSSHAT